MNVAIVATGSLSKGRLFDVENGRDACLERYRAFQKSAMKLDIHVKTHDQFEFNNIDIIIFHDIHRELGIVLNLVKKNPYAYLFYSPNEPPLISPANSSSFLSFLRVHKILTWNDDVVESLPNATKINIGQPVIRKNQIPQIKFSNKRFIAAVFGAKSSSIKGELYTERLKSFEYFSQKPEGFDLFGTGWAKRTETFLVNAYKGTVESKINTLRNYKFSICYENSSLYRGYITEKIFDCFAAGTVPIYYGAPNISDYISSECYIDFREYESYDHLYEYLISMPEQTYQDYLDSIKKYICTEEYKIFSSFGYANKMCELCISTLYCSSSQISTILFKLGLVKAVLKNIPIVFRQPKSFRRFFYELAVNW